MKKYNLNDTWKHCQQMWKWVAKKREEGYGASIVDLKDEWCNKHGSKNIKADCFFCHYVKTHAGNGCIRCPGGKVDKDFGCENPLYDYVRKPTKFYKEVKRLNRIRLKKRSKK